MVRLCLLRLCLGLCFLVLQTSSSWWHLGDRLLELDTSDDVDDATTDGAIPLTCKDIMMTRKQTSICEKGEKSMMVAIGQGIIAADYHCKKQFKSDRWNCTAPRGQERPFGNIALFGTPEAAYLYALSSAGAAYSLTHACADGSMSLTCGCVPRDKLEPWPNRSIEWGSCSYDVAKGVHLARKFVDAAEEADNGVYTERQMINLHNNKAGRLAVQNSLRTICHCYGFKSCIHRVCYKELTKFSYVAGVLKSKYDTAIKARINSRNTKLKSWDATRRIKSEDLVFNDGSWDLCEPDLPHGVLGIHGRECSSNSSEENYCDRLCCHRGSEQFLVDEVYACDCRLIWWPNLHMVCNKCYRRGVTKHRCK